MIEVDVDALRDVAKIAEANARVEVAKERLAAAKRAYGEAVTKHEAAVSSARSAIVQAAAGADINAEARAAEVTAAAGAIKFRADLVAACEAAVDGELAKLPGARHDAQVPIARKGKELRMAACVAADRARAALAEADALFQQGTMLIRGAHEDGMMGTPAPPTAGSVAMMRPAGAPGTQPPRNPVWSEADEIKLWEPRHDR